MRYVGGKSRIAKPIAEIILSAKGERSLYVEPFLGGASVFALVAPHFKQAVGADVVEDLILLWRAARDGWVPPVDLDEETYRQLKADPVPSALRGFAGFGCSFGGKWFGGYARGKTSTGAMRSFPEEGSRRIVARAQGMAGADLFRIDYCDLTHLATPDAVFYCDPPYAGTTGYGAAGAWCAEEFWCTAADWTDRGALVLVSEYAAPGEWNVLWRKAHRQSLQGGTSARPATVECLYTRFPPATALPVAA